MYDSPKAIHFSTGDGEIGFRDEIGRRARWYAADYAEGCGVDMLRPNPADASVLLRACSKASAEFRIDVTLADDVRQQWAYAFGDDVPEPAGVENVTGT